MDIIECELGELGNVGVDKDGSVGRMEWGREIVER